MIERDLVLGDCIVLYYGDRYYSTNRIPVGATAWAYMTFPQDPTVKQNRVCHILGSLMFAYEEDYLLYRLTWL